jgi:AcrR family transcriptional regulator
VGMLAKIRRMHFRDHLPLREIARQTGLSRNTIRHWLRKQDVVEPRYRARAARSVVDAWADQLGQWLNTDRHRPKRDRRTARAMFEAIRAQGYPGSYNRVCAFVKRWRADEASKPGCGLRADELRAGRRLPVRLELRVRLHWRTAPAAGSGAHQAGQQFRAFWLSAYPAQSHEMLFDAHARAFEAFGGVARRGIYDNMKTAVDKVGRGKERDRQRALPGDVLATTCSRPSSATRPRAGRRASSRRTCRTGAVRSGEKRPSGAGRIWPALNAWLGERCRQPAGPRWPPRVAER